MEPRAHRPYANLLVAAGRMAVREYWMLTEQQFVGEMMQAAGGSLHPDDCAKVYHRLMDDAGLDPVKGD